MSSAFARERIKQAHKGRETRGVLSKSTEHTVGASRRSIISLFVHCFVIFFGPLLGCVLAVFAASHHLSVPWSSVVVIARQTFPEVHPAALLSSIYVYWNLCVLFLNCTRPHALNVVKHQTFEIPWRFRRDHVSHMRLDRLRRTYKDTSSSGGAPEKASTPELVTVFVDIAAAGTVALTVTPMTTVLDIRHAICRRGHAPCTRGPIYLMGLRRPLRTFETMADLGVGALNHFFMPPRLLGGARGDLFVNGDTVVNENVWDQGAVNPDGTHKEAADMDFGEDPGTPPPTASGLSGFSFRTDFDTVSRVVTPSTA
ncbi:hypothetical protein FB451DRAFT_395024 [Mycena latifolia]|nr:hypothetical protein FB451DRAFT_395024 [Mycena latifolia]